MFDDNWGLIIYIFMKSQQLSNLMTNTLTYYYEYGVQFLKNSENGIYHGKFNEINVLV